VAGLGFVVGDGEGLPLGLGFVVGDGEGFSFGLGFVVGDGEGLPLAGLGFVSSP